MTRFEAFEGIHSIGGSFQAIESGCYSIAEEYHDASIAGTRMYGQSATLYEIV
jgi:hypothetical protein